MKKNQAAKNYYDILEVSRTSSSGVIRAAYKVLMQKYHPDKNTETTNNDFLKKTNLIRTAYECLSDEIKRKEYDLEIFGDLQVGSEKNLNNGSLSQKNDADFTVENTMVSAPIIHAKNKNSDYKVHLGGIVVIIILILYSVFVSTQEKNESLKKIEINKQQEIKILNEINMRKEKEEQEKKEQEN